MPDPCSQQLLSQEADKCAYVLENCNNQITVKFTHLFYCSYNENMIILFLISPFLFFICFHFISRTADDHLAPSVASITKYYKLSQTFAGVTLIAFANGVPDLLAAVIALQGPDGVLLAVGSIFGAGLFITTFVLASVIYFSTVIRVPKASFMRDVLFNSVGILSTIIFAVIGEINYIMSIYMICVYLIYIVVVLYNEKNSSKKSLQAQKSIEDQMAHVDDQQENLIKKQPSLENMLPEEQIPDLLNKKLSVEGRNSKLLIEQEEARDHPKQSQVAEQNEEEIISSDQSSPWYIIVFDAYAKLFNLIRVYTIPAATEKEHTQTLLIVHCLVCPFVMLLLLQSLGATFFGVSWLIILYVFSLTILAFGLCKVDVFIWVLFSSVACSVIWCKTVVEIVIDFLLLIQVVTGISSAYLGMTFLAFGNSSCDLLVDVQFAKMGFGLMALTGCFSAFNFNFFVGFGTAVVIQTMIVQTKGSVAFDLFGDPKDTTGFEQFMIARMNNSIAYCVLLFFMISNLMTIIVVRTNRFKLTRNVAKFFFILYIVFFLVITAIAIALVQVMDYIKPK